MKMNGDGEREGNRKQQNASLGGGACKALDRVYRVSTIGGGGGLVGWC